MAGLTGKKGGMTGSENPIVDPRFLLLCLSIYLSILAMKILAIATAIFVPMAVPWVCR